MNLGTCIWAQHQLLLQRRGRRMQHNLEKSERLQICRDQQGRRSSSPSAAAPLSGDGARRGFVGAGAVPAPRGRAVCRAPAPSCRYLRELGRCLGIPAGQKCPFSAQRCRASAAGAGFGASPQPPNRSGAGLAFLVALAILLSVASTSSLYFLTPTCLFTSSSYLSELKGLFHEKKKKNPPRQRGAFVVVWVMPGRAQGVCASSQSAADPGGHPLPAGSSCPSRGVGVVHGLPGTAGHASPKEKRMYSPKKAAGHTSPPASIRGWHFRAVPWQQPRGGTGAHPVLKSHTMASIKCLHPLNPREMKPKKPSG